jgi:hypothetical protein
MLTNPLPSALSVSWEGRKLGGKETPMTDTLETAIRELWNIDPDLLAYPYANAREKAITAGLHALAAVYGKEIEYTYINARGEFQFNILGAREGRGGEYGEELAAVLSHVKHRTGMDSTSSPLLPENNWCWINHFEAERLLKIVGVDFYDIHGPDARSEEMDELSLDENVADESFQMGL